VCSSPTWATPTPPAPPSPTTAGSAPATSAWSSPAAAAYALRLSGFLTDPVEIERRLLLHPSVMAAQVVGVTGAGGGDVAVAFVVTAGEAAPSEDELVAHCGAGLANYKVPRRVVVVEAFPTVEGPNGVKIRKTELRERAGRLLG
jgi:fatty-acyl-CoA synthase